MEEIEKRMINSIIATATIFNYGISKAESYKRLMAKLQMYSYSVEKKAGFTFRDDNTIDMLLIGDCVFNYSYEREEFV